MPCISVSSAELDRSTNGDGHGDGTGPINTVDNGPNMSPTPICELEMELTGNSPIDDEMGEDISPLFDDI